MSGRVRRRTITPMFTSTNANSVPMFTSSAIVVSGTNAASTEISAAKMNVTAIGVPVRSFTFDSQRGISPSRDIANVIRVCP
jgi:hypothetical protein